MSAHALPLRIYLGIFFALMVLTAVTTAVAYVDLGSMNTVVAMAIATLKALLVALYFMHLRYSSKLLWVFVMAGILFLLILFGMLMADPITRSTGTSWEAPQINTETMAPAAGH